VDEPKQILTVEEANQRLPKATQLVEQIQGIQHSLLNTNHALDEAVQKLAQGNGYPLQELKQQVEDLTKHQLHLIEALHSTIQQLENLGGYLKDVTMGLVDFCGMRDGELIWLCWRLGEEQIRFWHGLEEGFAGRQPI